MKEIEILRDKIISKTENMPSTLKQLLGRLRRSV